MAIKENSADILQKQKLRREKELSPKSRISDIIITVIFCLFIGGFTLIHIITPDKEYSERENRMLEKFPEFSSSALFSGEYTSNITKYLSDQFPFRDAMVSIKANTERFALRMENNGIIFGKDSLTARLENPNTENLDVNLTSADGFAAGIEKDKIPCILAIAPRRVDVCIDDLPASYGDNSQNDLWNIIDSYGNNFSGIYVNLREKLLSANSLGDEIYYRCDHHWTSLGAYYAYTTILQALPEPLWADTYNYRTLDTFTRETVTDEFYGTSYSSSGATWVSPDIIELFRYDGDGEIPVKVADTGEVFEGLYRMEYLDVRDKYSVFLGENAGRIDIGYGNRQKIVVIKDSFAQSLVPFLAADFDIVMIDPRYFSGSIYRTVIEESPEAVIILMNADTLTSDDVLRPLMRGVK